AATPICGPPHATHSKGCDQVVLIASGVAAHEHLAVLGVGDRQAGLAIVMRRAARHPAAAHLAAAEGLRNTLSGHGAPGGPVAVDDSRARRTVSPDLRPRAGS